MTTKMVQNGTVVEGENSSSTYSESTGNQIALYNNIYSMMGLRKYYGKNTEAANIVLSVILVIIIILLIIAGVKLFYKKSFSTANGGSIMYGGGNKYFSVIKTPQIVHDILD